MKNEFKNTMDFIKSTSITDGGFISKSGNLLGGNKGKLRSRVNGTTITLARAMFFYHHGAFPTKVKYLDSNERNINIDNLGTCKWLEDKIQMAKAWNKRKIAGGNRYDNGGLNTVYCNSMSEAQKFKAKKVQTKYLQKCFSEVLLEDKFIWDADVWIRRDGVNFLTNAFNSIGELKRFSADTVVTDLSNPIEEQVDDKVIWDEAGKKEYSKRTILVPFSKVNLKEQFSSLGINYTKLSNSRLEDGSNALRMDDSTAYIANDRKVEVYR